MKIGDINVADSIINLEIQLIKQGKILDWIANHNHLPSKPTMDDVNRMEKEALDIIVKKYPNMGIGRIN